MKPYNPLEKENLGKSVAESLLNSPAHALGDLKSFAGAGIYAIYYTGKFDPYGPIARLNQDPEDLQLPIYIGKAIPSGGRKGVIDPEISAKGRKLHERLKKHAASIEAVANLKIDDFYCRYLVVDDVWIPLGESLLIQHFRPLWNVVVEGFGNNDPGGNRKGARPSWDVLHVGRPWADKCIDSKLTAQEILERIDQHLT